MEFLNLVRDNLFNAFPTLVLAGALLVDAYYSRDEAKQRRITNQWEIVKQHSQLWLHRLSNPKLARIEDPSRNLETEPVTADERLFIHLLILLSAKSYQAAKAGMFTLPEAMTADISSFFATRIPRMVWDETKRFHNADFIQFVENSL